MRYLNTGELLSEQIDMQYLFTLSVHEPLGYERVFKDKNRNCNVLCIYNDGRRRYTLADGSEFYLEAGDILFIPQYSSYRFRIIDTGSEKLDYAIAVNFLMTDYDGNSISFGEIPRILLRDRQTHYYSVFKRLETSKTKMTHSMMLEKSLLYSLMYEILSELYKAEASQKPYGIIMPAIDEIESNPALDIPIPVLAERCGVSETRFRQLFRLYTGGISPVEYRNRLRIEMAERILYTETVTVEYAARESGFNDIAHFYRMYKKYKGTVPHRKC